MNSTYSLNAICRSALLLILFVLLSGFHWWDPVAKWMGIGNAAVESGEIETAAEAYSKAENAEPSHEKLLYNKALIDVMNEDVEAALDKLSKVSNSEDTDVRAQALYNKGCVELMSGDPASAAESFTESLKLNPNDSASKTNLEIALTTLEQMPTPTPSNDQQNQDNSENQDQNQDQNQNQQNQDGQENQENQDNNAESQQPTPTPTADPESQSGNQENNPSPTPQTDPGQSQEQQQGQEGQGQELKVEEGKMSPQEAERLLDAQEEQEMEVLQKFHQLPPVKDRDIEKDW